MVVENVLISQQLVNGVDVRPASSKCVEKPWRREWQLAGFVIRASSTAFRGTVS